MPSRRDFLQQLSALGLGVARLPLLAPVRRTRFTADPFTLGIASGDPATDGFVLWTRLAPDPTEGGGMGQEHVSVRWEVAADDQMRRIVKRGTATASPDVAHAVHVEVNGLQPDRWYWYRFMTGDAHTAVGRARTMPALSALPERMRLIVASCQHYEQGYYAAHRHIAQESPDLVAFLGDYIYESHHQGAPRVHVGLEPTTLEAYRTRYAQYRTDPDLQLAHASCPWIVTFDDHEVDNNYAGLLSADGESVESFTLRRAAAYRAYYEHMPLRRATIPRGPDMLLYRRLSFGRLAQFHVLDSRQYRDDQACGDGRKPPCEEWGREDRTMLGATQERWVQEGLGASRATWNVLAQQVLFTPMDVDPGPGEAYAMDTWGGYPAAHRRLTRFVAERRVPNLVTLTGDIHASYAAETPADHGVADSPRIGVEYIATSISSGGDGVDAYPQMGRVLEANPWFKYHSARRGYIRCDVTPQGWHADYRLLPHVHAADAPVATAASFVTPVGEAKVERT